MPSVIDSVRLEYQSGPQVPVPAPRVSWVTVGARRELTQGFLPA